MISIARILGIRDDRYLKIAFNKPGRLDFTMEGNVEILNSLPLDRRRFKIVDILLPFIAPSKEHIESLKLIHEKFDVIVNEICEPDICRNALTSAIHFLKDNISTPVINHPRFVIEISRDSVSRKLQGINGLYVPRIIRVRPNSLKSVKELVEKENFYPFIFREIGKHTYSEAVLIRSKEEIERLEVFSFRGDEYYLIEFVDYKSSDGLYRKYRVFFVSGRMYPRALIVSDYWNIHARDRERIMNKSVKYRDEDALWLKNFKEKDYEPLLKVYEILKLDLFIVDFGIMRDGKIVLFEASPCFKYISTGIGQEYNYHKPYIDNIQKAIIRLIEEAANKKRNKTMS